MVTNRQVRKLMDERKKHGQLGKATMRADMHRKTARKYRDHGKLPCELKEPRTWRTRTRQPRAGAGLVSHGKPARAGTCRRGRSIGPTLRGHNPARAGHRHDDEAGPPSFGPGPRCGGQLVQSPRKGPSHRPAGRGGAVLVAVSPAERRGSHQPRRWLQV